MIRLRGKKTATPTASAPAVDGNSAATTALNRTVNKRQFLRTLMTGAGLAVLAEWGPPALAPRGAEATHAPISGDVVNGDLTVRGNLAVGDSSTGAALGVRRYAWQTPGLIVDTTGGNISSTVVQIRHHGGGGGEPGLSIWSTNLGQELLVDKTGCVGIGTGIVSAKLDVAGDVRIDGPLKIGSRVIADSSGAYYAP